MTASEQSALLADLTREGWQPYATAPAHIDLHWWIACAEEGVAGGWMKTGQRFDSGEPLCIVDEYGITYSPHENGGYPTHWHPFPEPPAVAMQGEVSAFDIIDKPAGFSPRLSSRADDMLVVGRSSATLSRDGGGK